MPKDDAWNQYLVNCTAQLVVDAAKRLRENRLLTISALEALAVDSSKYDFGGPASMFKPIANALIHALREEALVPAYPSGYVAGKNAVLARAENVRSMLNSGELTELLGTTTKNAGFQAMSPEIEKRNLRDFLLTKLNVTELDAEGFARKVTDNFIASRSDRWIERYYEFLYEQSAVRRKLALSDRKIIRLSNDKHVQVNDSNGLDWPTFLLVKRPAFQPSKPLFAKVRMHGNS